MMLLVATSATFTQEKPTVVIVPFDAKGVNQSEVDVISDVFLSEYASTGKAIVVDRGSFDKIKKEHQFQLSEWSDTTKVVRLGKALNAHQIITGQISKFGNQVVCTIKLIDVNTTEIISSSVKRVASVELLFDECIALSREIAIKAKIPSVYDIGDKGPGGGIVFLKDGDWRWEISNSIDSCYSGEKDKFIGVDIGGFIDWTFPTLEECTLVYKNLVETGEIPNFGKYFFLGNYNDSIFLFSDGQVSRSRDNIADIRLVRKFNINNTTRDVVKDKINYITQNISGEYTRTNDSDSVIGHYDSGGRSPLTDYRPFKDLLDKMQLTSSLVMNIDGSWELKSEYIECNFSSSKRSSFESWSNGYTYIGKKYANLKPLKKAEKKFFSIKGSWSVKYKNGKYYIYINDESKNYFGCDECYMEVALKDNFINLEYNIPVFKFNVLCKDKWYNVFGYRTEEFDRDL